MEQIVEEYGGFIIALIFVLIVVGSICFVAFGADDGNSILGRFIQLVFSRFC